jgi:hypothetical protein
MRNGNCVCPVEEILKMCKITDYIRWKCSGSAERQTEMEKAPLPVESRDTGLID